MIRSDTVPNGNFAVFAKTLSHLLQKSFPALFASSHCVNSPSLRLIAWHLSSSEVMKGNKNLVLAADFFFSFFFSSESESDPTSSASGSSSDGCAFFSSDDDEDDDDEEETARPLLTFTFAAAEDFFLAAGLGFGPEMDDPPMNSRASSKSNLYLSDRVLTTTLT